MDSRRHPGGWLTALLCGSVLALLTGSYTILEFFTLVQKCKSITQGITQAGSLEKQWAGEAEAWPTGE